jgi:hypothetical protein
MSERTTIVLDRASIDAIAERVTEQVADLLRGESISDELIDAAEVARRLGVSRAYVYEHADELGARRLTDSPRSRLRFDPELIVDRPERDEPRPEPVRRKPAPRRSRADVDLLPVGRKRP